MPSHTFLDINCLCLYVFVLALNNKSAAPLMTHNGPPTRALASGFVGDQVTDVTQYRQRGTSRATKSGIQPHHPRQEATLTGTIYSIISIVFSGRMIRSGVRSGVCLVRTTRAAGPGKGHVGGTCRGCITSASRLQGSARACGSTKIALYSLLFTASGLARPRKEPARACWVLQRPRESTCRVCSGSGLASGIANSTNRSVGPPCRPERRGSPSP